jgi:hypothetical protein
MDEWHVISRVDASAQCAYVIGPSVTDFSIGPLLVLWCPVIVSCVSAFIYNQSSEDFL